MLLLIEGTASAKQASYSGVCTAKYGGLAWGLLLAFLACEVVLLPRQMPRRLLNHSSSGSC